MIIMKKFILSVIVIVVIAAVGYYGWNWWQGNRQELPPAGELVDNLLPEEEQTEDGFSLSGLLGDLTGGEDKEQTEDGFSLSGLLGSLTGGEEKQPGEDGFSLSGLLGSLTGDNGLGEITGDLNVTDILEVMDKADIDLGQVMQGITSGDSQVLDDLKDKLSSISIDDLQSMGIYNIDDQIAFDSAKEIHTEELNEVNLGYDIHELDLQIGGCTLTIIPTAGADYYLSAKNYGQLQYSVENQVLTILSVKSSGEVQDITDGQIKLYVPEELPLRKLKMDLAAGSFNVGTLFSYNTELNVNAGDADIKLLQGPEATINLNAGEIKMAADISSQMDIHNSMGNFELTLTGKQSDYNYQVSSAMGNVDLGTLDYSGAASGESVDNGASKRVHLENSMGNLTVNFTE